MSRTRPVHVSVVLERDSKVLFVQEAKTINRGLWNLPGGHVERGELVTAGAMREALEETGIEVELVDVVGVYVTGSAVRVVVRAIGHGEPVAGDEISDVAWIALSRLLAMRNDELVAPALLRSICSDLAQGISYPLNVLRESQPWDLRNAISSDRPFLELMLHEAAYSGAAKRPLIAEMMIDDEIARYLDTWPEKGEPGVIALDTDGIGIGAAWYRVLPSHRPGYGFVDAHTPELTMAVHPDHRHRGVGQSLMDVILGLARADGHRKLSLSVLDRNHIAVRLYRANGFVEHSRISGASTTMLASLV